MLSKEFFKALNTTWQAIGMDCGDVEDNEEAVELCLDADRIKYHGGEHGEVAQEEFRALMTKTGYANALKQVCKEMQYPFV